MAFPEKVDYVIVGAGIHGLSTAWHLASKLKAKGKGDGSKIVVIDKDSIAAGASGIACGVVRNNYYQPAMRELMALCVDVWESDAKNFHYHDVGYMQISPECMEEDVAEIYAQQKNIGYESEFIQGKKDSENYMKKMFGDWQAKGITSVLHEKRGGYANNTSAIYGLADKAEAEGVRILTGTTVKGFQYGSNSSAVTGIETDKGIIKCDHVIVGAGPWAKTFWDMLELPNEISEYIKIIHGNLNHSSKDKIKVDLNNGINKIITYDLLNGIIKPRYEEILEIIRDKLEENLISRIGLNKIVFTGGASQIQGILELASKVFNRDSRLAHPDSEEIEFNKPEFSTIWGLVKIMSDNKLKSIISSKLRKQRLNLIEKLDNWITESVI